MLDFFRAGGFNMYALAAFGLVMIPQAALFARNADAQRLSLIRALTWAVVCCTIVGFMAGLASTAKYVVAHPEAPALPSLLQGFAESTANIVLGGSIAVIAWLLVAVGVRRMPQDPS